MRRSWNEVPYTIYIKQIFKKIYILCLGSSGENDFLSIDTSDGVRLVCF